MYTLAVLIHFGQSSRSPSLKEMVTTSKEHVDIFITILTLPKKLVRITLDTRLHSNDVSTTTYVNF